MRIIGLDLGGVEQVQTSFCYMTDSVEEIANLKSTEDIKKRVEEKNPDIVVINAPLSLPDKGNLRKAEEELEKKNIKFMEPRGFLKPEKLVMRGMELKHHFEEKGYLVLEANTGAFYDLVRIPREKNYLAIKRVLQIFGIELKKKKYAQEMLNAVTSAFTGRLFLEGKVEFLGHEDEGQIVIPKIR